MIVSRRAHFESAISAWEDQTPCGRRCKFRCGTSGCLLPNKRAYNCRSLSGNESRVGPLKLYVRSAGFSNGLDCWLGTGSGGTVGPERFRCPSLGAECSIRGYFSAERPALRASRAWPIKNLILHCVLKSASSRLETRSFNVRSQSTAISRKRWSG